MLLSTLLCRVRGKLRLRKRKEKCAWSDDQRMVQKGQRLVHSRNTHFESSPDYCLFVGFHDSVFIANEIGVIAFNFIWLAGEFHSFLVLNFSIARSWRSGRLVQNSALLNDILEFDLFKISAVTHFIGLTLF